MEQGFNTLVESTRKNIAKAVQDGLNSGVPISVVSMMVDSVLFELRIGVEKTLAQEKVKYEEQLKAESQQVEWVDPVESDPIKAEIVK